jgi:hypothetical protein
MYVLIFFTASVWNIPHSKKSGKYRECTYWFVASIRNSRQILTKIEFSRQIFEKYSSIKNHENPSSGSRVVPCGRTDIRKDEGGRHDEPESSLFTIFRTHLQMYYLYIGYIILIYIGRKMLGFKFKQRCWWRFRPYVMLQIVSLWSVTDFRRSVLPLRCWTTRPCTCTQNAPV